MRDRVRLVIGTLTLVAFNLLVLSRGFAPFPGDPVGVRFMNDLGRPATLEHCSDPACGSFLFRDDVPTGATAPEFYELGYKEMWKVLAHPTLRGEPETGVAIVGCITIYSPDSGYYSMPPPFRLSSATPCPTALASPQASTTSIFSPFVVFVVVMGIYGGIALMFVVLWWIVVKAGFSGAWTLVMLIPLIGLVEWAIILLAAIHQRKVSAPTPPRLPI